MEAAGKEKEGFSILLHTVNIPFTINTGTYLMKQS